MKRYLGISRENLSRALRGIYRVEEELIQEALLNLGICEQPLLFDVQTGEHLYIPQHDILACTFSRTNGLKPGTVLWKPDTLSCTEWEQSLTSAFSRVSVNPSPLVTTIASEIKCRISPETFVALTQTVDVAEFLVRETGEKICGKTVRRLQKTDFYFDDNKILQARVQSKSAPSNKDARYFTAPFNGSIWRAACTKWEEGMSFRECVDIYLATTTTPKTSGKYTFLERLCPRIEKPIFERALANKAKGTFDRIRITVCLNSSMFDTRQELMACIKENRAGIDQMVIDAITQTKQFQTYNVSPDHLKVTAARMNSDYTLDLIVSRFNNEIGKNAVPNAGLREK